MNITAPRIEFLRRKPPKRLFIVAGETSGDTHGAALVGELRRREPELEISGLGGPRMAAAGVRILKDLTTHAVIGLAGLVDNLGGLIRAYRTILHKLTVERPDAIVLIDFPDFNLLVARHARKMGVPVIYYVSPQVWAWRTGRIRKIAERVRKMLVFFEFERALYERAGVDVTFVGHPLLDTMADKLDVTDRVGVRRSLGLPESGPLVGLLPGSRRKEIEHVFPVLLEAAEIVRREIPGVTFAASQAPGLKAKQFKRIAAKYDAPHVLVPGRAHDVMLACDLLLICSGTATLEAGLLGTPMVVTYKADLLSYILFGPLIAPGHLALANIVAEQRVVPEFYMIDAKPKKIAAAAVGLFRGGLDEMRQRLSGIRSRLGQPGASGRAADEILKIL